MAQPSVEGQRQLLHTTATPVFQRSPGYGRRHDTLPIATLTLPVHIVLHVEAVSHFVGQRPRLDADVIRVDHYDRTGVVTGTHSAELGLPDDVILEVDRRQQLGVVIRM